MINPSSQPDNIIIPVGDKEAAKATSVIKFKSNLNSGTAVAIDPNSPTDQERATGLVHSTSIKAYDTAGNTYDVTLEFNKVSENRWRVSTRVPGSIEGSVRSDVGNPTPDATNVFYVNFDNGFAFAEDGMESTDAMNAGDLSVNLSFIVNDGTLNAQGNPIGRRPSGWTSTVAYVGITQFNAETTTKAVEQDG